MIILKTGIITHDLYPGIQVVNDPSTIVLVENHRVRLRQLVTAVGDFMSR